MNSKENASFWTAERVERLKVLWALGWTCSAIARDIGQPTRSAITGKAFRLGLPRRRDPANFNKAPRIRAVKSPAKPARVPPPPKTNPTAKEKSPMAEVSRERAFDPLPGFEPVSFVDRRPGGCRWPIDGAEATVLLCCNRIRDFGHQSYCATHRALAGQKRPKLAAEAVKDDARRFGKFQFGRAA